MRFVTLLVALGALGGCGSVVEKTGSLEPLGLPERINASHGKEIRFVLKGQFESITLSNVKATDDEVCGLQGERKACYALTEIRRLYVRELSHDQADLAAKAVVAVPVCVVALPLCVAAAQ